MESQQEARQQAGERPGAILRHPGARASYLKVEQEIIVCNANVGYVRDDRPTSTDRERALCYPLTSTPFQNATKPLIFMAAGSGSG